MLLAALLLLAPCPAAPAPQERARIPHGPEIWISREQLKRLPNSGPEWTRVQTDADRPLVPNLVDKSDKTDTYVMAASFVWVRNRIPSYRDRVYEACAEVLWFSPPEEDDPPDDVSLAWSRNVTGYVIAAGLVSLPPGLDSSFKQWLASALPHLRRVHRSRPNNFGTHAGAARLAIALYLGDRAEELQAWDVFRRWLGDDTSPFNFELSSWGGSVCSWAWQGEPYPHFFGINRPGTTGIPCAGVRHALPVPSIARDIAGVLPDDQRRGELQECACPTGTCCFRWPPLKTNYVYEALQGVLAQAVMHYRRGRDPWFIAPDPSTGHGSILRAYEWLRDVADHPIGDPLNGHDDLWQAHIVNQVYGGLPGFVELDEIPTSAVGKAVSYADWTTLEPSWP